VVVVVVVVVVVAVDFEGFVVVVVEEEEDGCRGLATTGGRVDGRCGESIIWGETFLTDEMLLKIWQKKSKREIFVFSICLVCVLSPCFNFLCVCSLTPSFDRETSTPSIDCWTGASHKLRSQAEQGQ